MKIGDLVKRQDHPSNWIGLVVKIRGSLPMQQAEILWDNPYLDRLQATCNLEVVSESR